LWQSLTLGKEGSAEGSINAGKGEVAVFGGDGTILQKRENFR